MGDVDFLIVPMKTLMPENFRLPDGWDDDRTIPLLILWQDRAKPHD